MGMKAKTVYEFVRGRDPKEALGLGSCQEKQFEAMNSFFIFLFNADYDFIQKAWEGHWLVDHLESKLKSKLDKDSYMSPSVLAKFVSELDEENKRILYTYILNRHKQ